MNGTPKEYSWNELRHLGENEARQLIINKLKKAIELIEANGFPDIYDCKIENISPEWCHENFIERFSLTLSLPWPG